MDSGTDNPDVDEHTDNDDDELADLESTMIAPRKAVAGKTKENKQKEKARHK